ncbi:MAG: DNA replication/repair protein RecF [Clostridiales bacterium]|nr:DNA replication/repair protein RecF [Clostridiales bacterium]
MNVTVLKVKDYRNAAERTVELCPTRNAFVGANARGKTNLLEAVYFAGVGKSFRTPRDRELIKNDAPRAYISVTADKDTGSETVQIVIDRAVNKRVAINGVPITRMSELMGVCPVVLFCPDGLKIVKDAPADRRRFMDISLCQISKAYFAALSQYDKILQSRNKLLKSGGANDSTLAPWNELLADVGAKVIKSRRGFINKLAPIAQDKHSFLSGGKETLSLEYEGAGGEGVDGIKAELLRRFEADRESDYRLKYTHSGPHKDDIKISVDGVDLRAFGSQGQQRTAALAMKLAETKLLEDALGTSPVLLLDDVFSELDAGRRKKLLDTLDGLQSIITTTDKTDFDGVDINIVEI